MPADSYTVQVIRSRRKTVGLQIQSGSLVVVRAPLRMPVSELRRIVEEKRPWIDSHLAKAAVLEEAAKQVPPLTVQELRSLTDLALA